MYSGTQPLGNPPDSTQGYGRVTLKNVLPLPGHYNFDLFVDDLVYIAAYTTVKYVVQVLPNTPTLPPIK